VIEKERDRLKLEEPFRGAWQADFLLNLYISSLKRKRCQEPFPGAWRPASFLAMPSPA
jgi:hypothetical protein